MMAAVVLAVVGLVAAMVVLMEVVTAVLMVAVPMVEGYEAACIC